MTIKYITVFLVLFIVKINLVSTKGPHHPRNSHIIKRETRKEEFSEHLSHQDNE